MTPEREAEIRKSVSEIRCINCGKSTNEHDGPRWACRDFPENRFEEWNRQTYLGETDVRGLLSLLDYERAKFARHKATYECVKTGE